MAGCRQVFERWMEWEPDEQAWHSYINFELRYKEVDKGRSIYERYILPCSLCVCALCLCKNNSLMRRSLTPVNLLWSILK